LISIYAAWTRGYTFYGSPGPEMLNWSIGPILTAFFMGVSNYTSELTSKRAVFLLTRPVTWKGVLASKLLVNFCILLAAAVLAGLIYGVACPAAYKTLVNVSSLTTGCFWALVITCLAYLIGLSSSTVFQGAAESAVFAVVQGIVLIYFFSAIGTHSGMWCQLMLALWPIPLLIAGLTLARLGLTLPTAERFRRYLTAAFTSVLLTACIARAVPDSVINGVINTRLSPEHISWSISPDGLYAFGRDMKHLYWLDIPKDRLTSLEDVYEDYSGAHVIIEKVGWMSPHTPYRIGYGRDDWFIRTYQIKDKGVRRRDISMGKLRDRNGYPNEICASPDGRIAAVSLSTGMSLPQTLVFVDLLAGQKLAFQTTKFANTPVWWESSSVFCYTNPQGKACRKKI
jgi:hypothetical protein